MYFISKACKGHEFLYKREFTIACSSKKQAEKLANYLNENNDNMIAQWKLKDGETWHAYCNGIIEPLWKIRRRNGNVSVVPNTRKF